MSSEKIQWTMDLIKNLMEKKIGDQVRLDQIQTSLETNKEIQDEDKEYLKNLFQFFSTSKTGIADKKEINWKPILDKKHSENKTDDVFLETKSGLYYGGHKDHLAGVLTKKFDIGTMKLTKDYFVFIKTGLDLDKWHGLGVGVKEEWRLVIPLKSIQIEKWKVNEKTFPAAGIRFGLAIFGGGYIVIPYIDENGVPQEPRFGVTGVSSLIGRGIGEWAETLDRAMVEAQKDTLTKRTNQTNLEKTTPARAPIPNIQLTKRTNQTNLEKDKEEDPIKVLKMRLAKGEITKEEFEELRKMLES